MNEIFIHPTAIVEETAIIGKGSKIWHHSHIRAGATIGENCNIGKNVYVDAGVEIGHSCKIQNNVSVYAGVAVGNYVFIGPSVVFTNDPYPRAQYWDSSRLKRTLIGDGVSLGANSTIICGIKIGEFATVGAGSVVTRSVSDHALVFGNPARVRGMVCQCGNVISEIYVSSNYADRSMSCPNCKAGVSE